MDTENPTNKKEFGSLYAVVYGRLSRKFVQGKTVLFRSIYQHLGSGMRLNKQQTRKVLRELAESGMIKLNPHGAILLHSPIDYDAPKESKLRCSAVEVLPKRGGGFTVVHNEGILHKQVV